MNIRHIIFDWDGTLAMTLHVWMSGFQYALANQNTTMSESQIVSILFPGGSVAREHCLEVDIEALFTDTRIFVRERLGQVPLYSYAHTLLNSLVSKNIALSLVSSSTHDILEKGLHTQNVTHFFQSILSGCDVEKRKPHPEAFLKTLTQTGFSKEETLVVGDSKVDILAGKAAGIATCLFTPSENKRFYDFDLLSELSPDFKVTSLQDIETLFSK
jgi:pyrophosphatase PpaX